MRITSHVRFLLDALRLSVRSRGLLGTLRRAGRFLRRYAARVEQRGRSFDRTHGVETSEWEPVVVEGRTVLYEPSPLRLAEEALASLPLDHRRYSFVDVGSGKGRVLFLAARYSFESVCGVEISAPLHRQACANLEKSDSAAWACRRVASLCCDVAAYEFPDTDLVLYVYDPFPEPTMKVFLDRVFESLRKHERDAWLLYTGDAPESLISAAGFERQHALRVDHTEMRCYRWRPRALDS